MAASRDLPPARGTVTEILAHGAYRVELANGHRCVARTIKGAASTYPVGAQVDLELHPADLSRARIVG